jgi:ribonuclease HII
MLFTRFKDDNILEIGIDEAGRGSFWGPIVAGAMIIPNESDWSDKQRKLLIQLRDSKKISPKKREIIADEIKELIPKTAIGIVTAQEINDNGITWANMEAFRRAIYNLSITIEESKLSRIIIDGILEIKDWMGEQNTIIDGDAKYLAIAGASILAKVGHDRWITQFCKENPECNDNYDLVNSKGYGTLKHREGIKKYGAHELHRSLYIQNWLPGNTQKIKQKNKLNNKNKCLINLKAV